MYRMSDKIAEIMGIPLNPSKRYRLAPDKAKRLKEIKAQQKNAFESTLDNGGFEFPENWSHGWIKDKSTSVFVRNQRPVDIDDIADKVNEAVGNALKDVTWKKGAGNPKSGNLFVPSIFDLHLGKLAWNQETGEDYDVKIASQRFRDALEDLIEKASGYKVEKILFPIGNDFFNSDKSIPFATTTKGTPQTDDVRWQKMFVMGIQLITEAVIRLSKIAPLEVKTVFSNHDHERVFYLGETINAVFKNEPGITIDNSPSVRKYFKWEQCLIGLAHGHNERPEQLPLIMAQECKEMWASTFYREWLLGHLHHKQRFVTQDSKDYRGVRVTYLTSPSAADAWHYEKAFTGAIKGAEGFIYNKDEGHIGSVIHNIR